MPGLKPGIATSLMPMPAIATELFYCFASLTKFWWMKRSLIAFGGCGGIEPALGFVGLDARSTFPDMLLRCLLPSVAVVLFTVMHLARHSARTFSISKPCMTGGVATQSTTSLVSVMWSHDWSAALLARRASRASAYSASRARRIAWCFSSLFVRLVFGMLISTDRWISIGLQKINKIQDSVLSMSNENNVLLRVDEFVCCHWCLTWPLLSSGCRQHSLEYFLRQPKHKLIPCLCLVWNIFKVSYG